jgi:hypothetical protein
MTRDEIDDVQARIWRRQPDPNEPLWLVASGWAGWLALAVYLAWRLL